MTSVLSFDSRSMGYLLGDQFKQYFSYQFPLFYRNKIQKGPAGDKKFFYRSAIDSALKSNQIRAVQIIIGYIVKYQNQFVSSFLFNKNFPKLLEKGVEIKPLLDSKVFCFDFDLDEWPSAHSNPDEFIRPFNENMFMIRKHYRTVFPEENLAPLELSTQKLRGSRKLYKIKY